MDRSVRIGHVVRVHPLRTSAAALLSVAVLSACGGSSGGVPIADPSKPAASTTLPARGVDEPLPPNETRSWDLAVHCGAGVLSYKINGAWWRTAEAGNQANWMPAEWPDAASVSGITVLLEINSAGDELKVSHAGRTVIYAPTELTNADLCA